jgi:hypothetical protein
VTRSLSQGVAEADGNRTRRRRGAPSTSFEDWGDHQAPRRLRVDSTGGSPYAQCRAALSLGCWLPELAGLVVAGGLLDDDVHEASGRKAGRVGGNGHAWWEDAVVYEVYPRSFADADGNGVGDLPGLRSRLPYLADLGVDAIWLTPFYPSPLADGGYDVSDYRAVDPLLGSLADFDGLVKDAEAHQIRVIVDLVPNHCSSAHPLFQAALAAAPGSPERARFIFREGRGPDGELPPNNWKSQFGGLAWTRVTEADGRPGQWYLHLFDTGQVGVDFAMVGV